MTAVKEPVRLPHAAAMNPGGRARRLKFWRRYEGLVYIAPVMGGIIAFQLIPILVSMYLSLADWNGINPPKFIGLGNFRQLFTDDPLYLETLRNTVLFTLGAIPATTVVAFVLALLCNRNVPGIAIFRAAYFAPYITNIVAIGYIWYWTSSESTEKAGFPTPVRRSAPSSY
jgi:ABC-type sugar transport system permease subunit